MGLREREQSKVVRVGSRTEALRKLREQNVPKGIGNNTAFFADRASGAKVVDVDGNEFIDFAGGIGVLNVGHCHPLVVQAVREQAEKFLHTCFHVVMYEPYILLAQRLNGLTPGSFAKKTMFANSGAEGVENAVKIARYASGKPGVIAFDNAFHGRTLLTMTLTGKTKPYKLGFGPFAPEVYRLPYAYCYRCALGTSYPGCGLACLEYLRDSFEIHAPAEKVAAIILEPVQGEGGFIVPPREFIAGVKQVCEEKGIVFIADEVQTGFGRTGKMFAIEHFGVIPDMVVMAKSLAAGLPLSAVTGRAELMDAPHVGGLGGTYGGNPLSCVAGLAVLEVFEKENLLENAQKVGRMLTERLQAMAERYSLIGDVRCLGAMAGIELVKDRATKEPATKETSKALQYAHEHGLIAIKAGVHDNVIRVLVPLVVDPDVLQEGLDVLEAAVAHASA